MALYFTGKSDWCPSWKGFELVAENGPCVKFHMNPLSWYDANSTCASDTLYSRLLVADTLAKNTDVNFYATVHGLSE